MHLLVISLFAILAGTLLLAKTKKEELSKFFHYISWFFLCVGFLLFIGFVAGGICKMRHCQGGAGNCHEMMINRCHQGMDCKSDCPPGMCKGSCEMDKNCMQHDSMMKCCPKQVSEDTIKKVKP
jgi:hypothetical protein